MVPSFLNTPLFTFRQRLFRPTPLFCHVRPRRVEASQGGGPNLEIVGAPRGGAQKGGSGAQKGGAPKGWAPQNFALFFPLPPENSFLLVVFAGRQMFTCGVLGLSCEAPAAPNSTSKHPEREEKNEFCGGRGKKRAKFWAVQGKGGRSRGRVVCLGEGRSGPGEGHSKHSEWATALKKEDGGVRGIVVSDVLRRLVARTMAKQCALSEKKRQRRSNTR